MAKFPNVGRRRYDMGLNRKPMFPSGRLEPVHAAMPLAMRAKPLKRQISALSGSAHEQELAVVPYCSNKDSSSLWRPICKKNKMAKTDGWDDLSPASSSVKEDRTIGTSLQNIGIGSEVVPKNSDVGIGSSKNSNYRGRLLFEKKLASSDVGDFNRLVIPIKYAEEYFPSIQHIAEKKYETFILNFTDKQSWKWEMKYEYWSASQSYVLTKGWKAFVNYHGLRINDVIQIFQVYDPEYEVNKNKKEIMHFGMDFYRPTPEHPVMVTVTEMKTLRLFGKDICEYECTKMVPSSDGGEPVVVDEKLYHSNGGRRRNRRANTKTDNAESTQVEGKIFTMEQQI